MTTAPSDEATQEAARILHDEIASVDVTDTVVEWFQETASKEPCRVCAVIAHALDKAKASGVRDEREDLLRVFTHFPARGMRERVRNTLRDRLERALRTDQESETKP